MYVGQGRELAWSRRPRALSRAQVLEIFAGKTAPAFEVALRLGAVLAGGDAAWAGILTEYSSALGAAYQIQDDLDDFHGGAGGDVRMLRPSILAALAWERAQGAERTLLARYWRRESLGPAEAAELVRVLRGLGVEAEAMALLAGYKARALGCLQGLTNSALKSLLRRVICRIFGDIEALRCCADYQAEHGGGSEKGKA